MRNVLKSTLVAAVAAAGLGTVAQATSLTWDVPGYAGPIYIQYSNFDVGRLYQPGIVTPVLPGGQGAAVVDAVTGTGNVPVIGSGSPVEDTWGTVNVSGIWGGFDNTGTVLYSAASSPIQLTGIFWGARDIQLDSTPVVSQQIWSDSIQMSFFASKVGDNSDGLDFPVSGGLAASRTNLPGNIPVFAGVTDGSLVWTLRGTPGVSASNPFAELHVNIDLTLLNGPTGGVVGGGTMFLNLSSNDMGAGLQNGMLYADPLNPDVSVAFQDYKPPAGSGYTVRSSDPALAVAIPTPSAAYGGALLAGLIGLNTLRRRRAQ